MNDPSQIEFPPGQGPGPTNPFEPLQLRDVEQSIPDLFARQAARFASNIAVESATDRLTYAELHSRSDQLAVEILNRLGPSVEAVALLVAPGAAQLVAILGALKAGKIYLPLDPAYPAPRNEAVLRAARPALLIADDENHRLAAQLAVDVPVLNLRDVADPSGHPASLPAIDPGQGATIIYTSGSTGQPSGILHSHRNLLHAALKYTNNFHVAASDRMLQLYSCAFIGAVGEIFPALLSGATLVPFDVKRQGIGALASWMTQHKITSYQSVPTLFRRFAATLNGKEDFSALRIIRLGGESVTPQDVALFRRHFGPSCVLAVSLAATELLGIRLFFVDRDLPLSGPRLPVGYALQDTHVQLVDERGNEVEPGQVGEMLISSPYLALGYWNDEPRTAAAFRPDPNRPGHRTYFLRDLGRLRADGCLEYLGRKDWQVKVRGHRIELAEVEAALLAIPQVKEAAVIGQETATDGQRLVAYLAPQPNAALTVSLLRAALQEQLPEYMIPAVFVLLNSLPTTPSGKIDRQSLPTPTNNRPLLKNEFVRPRDPLQVALAEIWKDCLNIAPIGVRDDFFELGGDSILAIDMALRVEQMFGRNLQQSQLLASRTIEQLASVLLAAENATTLPPLHEIPSAAPGRPLFFLHGDFNGGGLYCVPLARKLNDACPLIAVHPHGVAGSLVPASIEEMASDRLAAIRNSQPHGPYRLGGHCNGALVALAIAQRLIEQGEQVEFLALLAPPHTVQWESAAPLPSTNGHRPATDLSATPPAQRSAMLQNAYHHACKDFVVTRYPGPLLIVLPENDVGRYGKLENWQSRAARVDVQVVPGAHLSMLAPRNSAALAKALREHLAAF